MLDISHNDVNAKCFFFEVAILDAPKKHTHKIQKQPGEGVSICIHSILPLRTICYLSLKHPEVLCAIKTHHFTVLPHR